MSDNVITVNFTKDTVKRDNIYAEHIIHHLKEAMDDLLTFKKYENNDMEVVVSYANMDYDVYREKLNTATVCIDDSNPYIFILNYLRQKNCKIDGDKFGGFIVLMIMIIHEFHDNDYYMTSSDNPVKLTIYFKTKNNKIATIDFFLK